MKKVIRISEQTNQKPIEFTHSLNEFNGWEETTISPNIFDKIVYLGNCSDDGDMFAAYQDGVIIIYKGYFNDGVY